MCGTRIVQHVPMHIIATEIASPISVRVCVCVLYINWTFSVAKIYEHHIRREKTMQSDKMQRNKMKMDKN